jgi:methyltransferase family protein
MGLGDMVLTGSDHRDAKGLLKELVKMSQSKLGFFPKTKIREIEYPWFAQRLGDRKASRILDLGAGVCVLPLWLADRGCAVTTVDNHSLVRDPRKKDGWNEWGFLDYSLIDKRIQSFNIDAAKFSPDDRFDRIYSVSALEHMPASIRRKIIGKSRSWLNDGGRMYLSFDLVPNSQALWPLSGGGVVDTVEDHGTFGDVLEELKVAGLRVLETSIMRWIESSRTDLAFVIADNPGGRP